MRHASVILGHPISTGFHGLMGCQQDPQKLGHHSYDRDVFDSVFYEPIVGLNDLVV